MSIKDNESRLGRPPCIHLHRLKIWVHGRQYPEATDYWDGNWLRVTVECSAETSYVSVSGSIIHLPELAQWATAARRVHATSSGEANLDCMEPELSVKLIVDRPGCIMMLVHIKEDCISEPHSFQFEIDQSYLPGLIRDCRAVLDTYPIKSKPNS